MPIFKAINKQYTSNRDLKNLVSYAVRKDKCFNKNYGAQGIIKGTAEEMYQQMMGVKRYFQKTSGRQAMHYMLSFDINENAYIGICEAMEIGYRFAEYLQGFQVVFGIHTDTDDLHMHFIINSVSYINGKKINMGPMELQWMKNMVQQMVKDYNSEVKNKSVEVAIEEICSDW